MPAKAWRDLWSTAARVALKIAPSMAAGVRVDAGHEPLGPRASVEEHAQRVDGAAVRRDRAERLGHAGGVRLVVGSEPRG